MGISRFFFLYTWLIVCCRFLNKIFLKALFWSFCILFWLVIFDWPLSWDPYHSWEQKREWYVIFRILRDALFLSLLRMPMAWFSLVATWFICFDHSKRSSKRTPRYFTVSVCINLFPSRIILRLGSVFLELGWKIINSVFVTLRDNLSLVSFKPLG